MPKHVLLKRATRRRYTEAPRLPSDAIYDSKAGYWKQAGAAMVRTREFAYSRVSKKCDLETGEDQKGE